MYSKDAILTVGDEWIGFVVRRAATGTRKTWELLNSLGWILFGKFIERFILLSILLLAIGAGACATVPKPLPPVAWEGEWIRYASTVGRLPCGDSLEFMEQRISALQTELDEPMAPGEKLTYYWLPGHMELSPCPQGGDCAEDLQVFSRTLFHDHEIVHVLLRKHGRSQTFLYEGLAEAYGRAGGSLTVQRVEARAEVLRSLAAWVDPRSISYPLAGLFVRYLIETYGFAAVKRLYIRAGPDTDIDRLQQLFEEELESTLDEVLDRFVADAPDCYPRTNLCVGEPIPWSGGVWSRRLGIECRSPGVTEIAPGMLRNESLVEIPEAGAYRITTSASSIPIEQIVVTRCTCQSSLHFVEPGSEVTVQLERGRYRVLVGRHPPDVESAADPVQVTIRPQPLEAGRTN